MSPYFSQTDLEYAVGGAATLVQLLDKDGDGVADAQFVARVQARATAEARSAIQVSTDLTVLEGGTLPDSLVYTSANIGAFYAYLEGTQGQGVPDHIRQAYDDALPRPVQDQPEVSIEPGGVSRRSLKSFW
jgi:hypothetical protein